jgi:spermidine dehydrogenase
MPDARILILDNSDDFDGHAKRNEFTLRGAGVVGGDRGKRRFLLF